MAGTLFPGVSVPDSQSQETPDITSRQIDPFQPPPDVEILPAKASISISGGQTVQAQFTVEVLSAEGDGIVGDPAAVHVGSLPAGITAELSPQSVVGQGEVTLTLTAAPNVRPTVATVIVSATAGPHASRSLVTLDVKATGQIRPKYQLLTLLYAPPGTKGGSRSTVSNVVYTTGSTTGTTTSISSSFETTETVTASVAGLGGSGEFTASQNTEDTSSVNIQKGENNAITVYGPDQDGIDHGSDMFYLWLNPLLNVTIDDHVTWELGVDGPTMAIQYVLASWLQDPSQMPEDVAQQLTEAGLTQTDYAEILSCDPFISGVTDPNRFALVQHISIPYEPPSSPNGPASSYTNSQFTNNTNTTTTTTKAKYKATLKDAISGTLEEWLTLKFSGSVEWTNTSTSTQTNGSSQSAAFTINPPALGYTGPTELFVYWDNVYSSFMFSFDSSPIPAPQPPPPLPPQPQHRGSSGSVAPVADNTVIAAQGPGGSLQFYWQPVGSGQWNPEQVAGPGTTG